MHGQKVELTLKEFELLKYLVENRGIVLTRDQLLTRIWGYDFDGETRTVDVHVRICVRNSAKQVHVLKLSVV